MRRARCAIPILAKKTCIRVVVRSLSKGGKKAEGAGAGSATNTTYVSALEGARALGVDCGELRARRGNEKGRDSALVAGTAVECERGGDGRCSRWRTAAGRGGGVRVRVDTWRSQQL